MFLCRLHQCEANATPMAIMCRKHWRVVPHRIKVQIQRLIIGTQVDPRSNPNAPKAWKILVSRAKLAVLKGQGKTDAMNDELSRLALLDPKPARVPGATKGNRSKRSGRGKPPAAHGAS